MSETKFLFQLSSFYLFRSINTQVSESTDALNTQVSESTKITAFKMPNCLSDLCKVSKKDILEEDVKSVAVKEYYFIAGS